MPIVDRCIQVDRVSFVYLLSLVNAVTYGAVLNLARGQREARKIREVSKGQHGGQTSAHERTL